MSRNLPIRGVILRAFISYAAACQVYHHPLAYRGLDRTAKTPAVAIPTTNPLHLGYVKIRYRAILTATGGAVPYTWSLSPGALPSGLSLDPMSGQITGTPTQGGTFSLNITVTDSSSATASKTFSLTVFEQTLDQYGGVTQTPCPGGQTGNWYTTQIGKRWVLCDPLGNAFIDRGVWYITGDGHTDPAYVPQSFNRTTASKYPNANTAWNAEMARLQAWGFNAGGPGSYPHATDTYVTTKLPFTEYLSTANNDWGKCQTEALQCKNIWNLLWPPTHTYDAAGIHPVTDAYDPNWPTDVANDYNADSNFTTFGSSPYLIGFFIGDTDFCPVCNAGVDFPTDPIGSYWPHVGYLILGSTPHVWLNRINSNNLFTDQTNNTKAQLSTFLSNRYGTIGALNTAWGTTYYTTFATSGTQGTAAACATGNGGSSYSCTPHTNIDRYSLRINVGGSAVCGDDGYGNLAGPADASCGTVTYSTGAIAITKATANGVAITVDYWHDGYGVGTGILDEWTDNTVHAWVGDSYCLNNSITNNVCNAGSVTTAAYRKDMDDFLHQYVTQFFTVLHRAFVNALPTGHKNKLFFGVSNLGQVPGRSPARCPVLAGEAAVADVVQVSTATSTAQLDFITNCIGNKPYTLWETVTANADSDWYGYAPNTTGTWNKTTQALRASQYDSDIKNLWNHCNSTTGNCQWVGENWWAFLSVGFYEHNNYGLVSWRDNAYDGHDVVTGTVSCSSRESAYTCGNEQRNFGNFQRGATITNGWVDTQLSGIRSQISGDATVSGREVVH